MLNSKQENKMSAFSIKTWLDKGYTEEEARYQIAIRRPNNILYYVSKGFTENEAREKIKQRQSIGGLKRSNMSLEEKRSLSPRCPEFYVAKGYTVEDAKEQVSRFQSTFSRKKCILKHGEAVGLEIFNSRQQKWQSTLNSKSTEELQAINKRKNRWLNLSEEESQSLKQQVASSVKETVSWRTPEQSRQVGKKIRDGQVESGRATSEDLMNAFLLYKNRVWAETRRNNLELLENYDQRGRSKYHLDHMFSIFEGFKQGVDPCIVGHIRNLKMIPAKENLSKFNKCSITLNDLELLIKAADDNN
jgi:hypothetical protein